ncbi:MAG: restriction endonuclease PLD domain-containing protein [Burkholderiaceae bacterium]
MITDDLYNRILIEPAKNGSDELFIVSGYSSASFLRRHMNEIKKINEKVKINLLIGMHQTRRDHSAYVDIIKSNPKSIEGHYYSGRPGVHSKVYTWIQNKSPREGFSGSANYSQYGFFEISQKNQMMRDDATQIMEYFLKLKTNSVNFLSYTPTEDELVQVENVAGSIPPGESEWIVPNESMRISF